MPQAEEPTEENSPDPRFKQTAVSNVQARDIQIGQIVQKIVYLGIPPNSPLRPFALTISIALYLTLLIVGFVLLWQDGAGFIPLLLLIVGSGLLSLTCLYYAWFWKPEIQDKSALSSARQRSRQQIRRLAIVGFFLIPLLTCAGFFGWRSLPPPKVVLLIANFDGVDQQRYQVTENILRNLRKATEPYADVKVQALNHTITEQQGSEVARAKGEQKKAAIVIWGEYGVTPTDVQIGFHYELLKPPEYFPELGEEANGKAQTLAIAELNSFKLQSRLSNEMSYLTLFTLGMVQYAKDDWGGAIVRFKSAIDQVKKPAATLGQEVVYFYRGNSFYREGNYKSAIADYDQALKLKPDLADVYNNRGVAYDNQGIVYDNQGIVYDNQGNFSQAIADFNQALKLKPDDADAYNNRGTAYDNLGNYTQAIADFNQALKRKPDSAEAYILRGIAYGNLGNYTQAIADFNQALKRKPDDADVYSSRGAAYDNLGNYTQAIADFNQALKRKPDDAYAYAMRGSAYTEQNNYIQAIADYNQALKRKPKFAAAYTLRGNAYYNQDNYTQAIADYNQALKFKPDNAEVYNNRGGVYIKQGNYTQGIADYNQALKRKPGYASAYYNKACAYSLKREVKAAIENLQRAIDLDAKYQEKAKTDSDFDNIRKDKQFHALVGK